MITPGYSLTAPERVLPRMALDFTTAVLDSRVTVTRALNTATRINSSGYIEVVNANLPRFDFSPTSVGTCRGLLIEEGRTNLCTYSQDFFNPPWVPVNASLTASSGISPDGTNNATNLTFSATSGFMARATAIPISANTTYTHSIYMRATSGTFKTKISRTNGATWATATVSPELTLTTTWQRFDITYTSGATDTVSDFIVGAESKTPYTMPATGTIQIYGAQVETGAFSTSYIPTVFTSVQRNADVVSMTGTNFSDWFNASQGAVFAEYIKKAGTGNNARVVSFGPFSAGSFASIAALGSNRTGWYAAGLVGLGTATDGAVNRQCIAYTNAGAFLGSINGGSPIVSAASDFTGVGSDTLWLGTQSTGANYLNSHLCKVMYWPQRLTNAEVQAFSK